jgi:hypothetical protein
MEFFAEVIHLLVGQWDVCLKVHRDCFNGFYFSAQNNTRTDFVLTIVIGYHEGV